MLTSVFLTLLVAAGARAVNPLPADDGPQNPVAAPAPGPGPENDETPVDPEEYLKLSIEIVDELGYFCSTIREAPPIIEGTPAVGDELKNANDLSLFLEQIPQQLSFFTYSPEDIFTDAPLVARDLAVRNQRMRRGGPTLQEPTRRDESQSSASGRHASRQVDQEVPEGGDSQDDDFPGPEASATMSEAVAKLSGNMNEVVDFVINAKPDLDTLSYTGPIRLNLLVTDQVLNSIQQDPQVGQPEFRDALPQIIESWQRAMTTFDVQKELEVPVAEPVPENRK